MSIVDDDLPESSRVRVFLLGQMEVWRRSGPEAAWQLIERQVWGNKDRKAATSVLRRLLTAPGRRLSRGRLLDDLWPDRDQESSLANALSCLRSVLGKDILESSQSPFYGLPPQSVLWVDLDACQQALAQVENAQGERQALLEQAEGLLSRGGCLEGEEGTWSYGPRMQAEEMLKRCRFWLADVYEEQGKYWQAGERYRAVLQNEPCEEALWKWVALLQRQGKQQEAQKISESYQRFFAEQGAPLEQHAPTTLTRRQTLVGLASAAAFGFSGAELLFADEALAMMTRALAACWDLFFGGQSAHAAALLPLYRAQLSALAGQPSPLQLQAASLASQAWQLSQELASDAENFGLAQQAAQQALLYARHAGDQHQQVASLIRLANTAFHCQDASQALAAYQQALPLLPQVSPLLQGRVYAGLAETHGMRGERQEALRAMGQAYERYPERPEEDPAYPYTRATHYSLRVFGDAQTHLFLRQPEEAARALEWVERHLVDPQIEPLSQLDLRYYQASAAAQADEREHAVSLLIEGAELARRIGSRLYYQKLATLARQMCQQQSATLADLDALFQPW